MKVVFMGTPDFSVGVLEKIIEAGHEVVLVVTQTDKPKGRGGKMAFSDVKQAALAHDLPIFQPDRIRKEEHVAYLREFEADVFVVAAYGQILPKEILEMPRYGCVNVHASLLPQYRGASPIQWAIIDGLKETGVTTMLMDEGLDTGDMIMKRTVAIAPDETGGSLFDKLSEVGAKLLVETLEALQEGTATFTKQESEQATYTTTIQKSLGRIDFDRPAQEISCLIRGLNPWPSAFGSYQKKMLKIWKASPVSEAEASEAYPLCDAEPGEIAYVGKKTLLVRCKDSYLSIEELQLEGKKRMEIDAFLRGVQMKEGESVCSR